jgi:hypothetical protein
MSNIKVESVGYCVIRQALSIGTHKADPVIQSFGPFNSSDGAEAFILEVAVGSIKKVKKDYNDSQYCYNITVLRQPSSHKEPIIVRSKTFQTYKSWRRAAMQLGGVRYEYNDDNRKIFDVNNNLIGESDGVTGWVYLKKFD